MKGKKMEVDKELWFQMNDLSWKAPVSCQTDSAVRMATAGGREVGWMCADGGRNEDEEIEERKWNCQRPKHNHLCFPLW